MAEKIESGDIKPSSTTNLKMPAMIQIRYNKDLS